MGGYSKLCDCFSYVQTSDEIKRLFSYLRLQTRLQAFQKDPSGLQSDQGFLCLQRQFLLDSPQLYKRRESCIKIWKLESSTK